MEVKWTHCVLFESCRWALSGFSEVWFNNESSNSYLSFPVDERYTEPFMEDKVQTGDV